MPPKRKRQDRGGGGDPGPNRPSPHRPGDSALAQQGGGYPESTRSGRGGRSTRRSDQSAVAFSPSSAAEAASASRSSAAAPVTTPSRPADRAPAAVNAVAPPPMSTPAPPPRSYEVVTDDRVTKWLAGGKEEVVGFGRQCLQDEDLTALSALFLELLYSMTDCRLAPQSAGVAVKEIVGPAPSESSGFDPHALFLDTISVSLEIEPGQLPPELRDFMIATNIAPMLMRQILDPPVLQHLGLIRETFVKIGIRQSTNLLYRQANYNLLREESEGYSKLKTELFTISSTEPPTSEAVKATFEKVKALIGTFDLDVGRVLDVTLDVFAAVLVKQFRFFIKLLRVSSWWPKRQIAHASNAYTGGLPKWALPDYRNWLTTEEEDAASAEERRRRDVKFWDTAREIHLDAFFELGGRQLGLEDEQRIAKASLNGDSEAEVEIIWMKETKTLPPPGNAVAAQLLGFKLRFYASDARDKEDILPANLLYLAALLIKVGFISITDLWEHLWPSEAKMLELKETKLKEIEEKEKLSRPGGAMNALMKAGALPDDSPSVPTIPSRRDPGTAKTDSEQKAAAPSSTDEKPALPEPMEQKVQLLIHLLTIGAIPESLFILGRYEWIPQAFPEILPLIHRIIHHSIETVYSEACANNPELNEMAAKRLPEPDQAGVPKGTVKLGQTPARRLLRWPHADNPNHDGHAYRYYWDEWADNVPVCQTVDDLFTLCSTFLNISGVNIGTDSDLLTKLASIGIKSLADDPSSENMVRWQDLLRRLLVPALSFTGSNSSVVDLVWRLLSLYPPTVRYTMYAEWFEGQISRLEPMRKAFARTRLETLSTMKRLSLTNISQMARTLAKTAYASPGVVFKVALEQIEAYSNLIDAFVECAKYFTDLGYDVLVWSLMSSLGGKQRSRTQESSVLLTSKWLQALSKFSGRVFKRYSVMNPTPVLQYVNDQLFSGNSTDLVILKELITAMGGVISDVDFTDAQLRAMTGGEALRRETLISLQDKRFDSVKSATRLMAALTRDKLAGRLLINIAQYRQSAIYRVSEDQAHIKFIATMVDDTHQVLVQFLELLRTNLKPEEFDELVPSIVDLMRDFGLDVSFAFMIGRASLFQRISSSKALTSAAREPQAASQKQLPAVTVVAADTDGDTPMETGAVDATGQAASSLAVNGVNGQTAGEAEQAAAASTNERKADPILDTLQPIIDAMPEVIAKDIWQQISPELFAIFWSLQLGDISVPESSYHAEHDRLHKQSVELMKDRSDMTRAGINKLSQKKKEMAGRMSVIKDELKRHIDQYQKTRSKLTKQSKTWFPGAMARVGQASDVLTEQCLLPRLLLSASDAEYSFKFVKFLHEIRAPNFKLMSLYDRFFQQNRLRCMIFSCTVREAEYLGRFLKCTLGDLSRWHGDKVLYEKEALGQTKADGNRTRTYTGFATEFDAEGKPVAFVEHDMFRDMLFRWHRNLNTALRSCLGGMEWMHIRNAITVLKTVIDYFPVITFMADKFLEQLKMITDREAASKTATGDEEEGHRVDLSVAAQTAYSELQRRKPHWVIVQAFRPNTSGELKEERERERPRETALRPTAAEFKAGRATSSTRKPSTAEVEDGEVKDGKDAKSAPTTTPSASAETDSAPNAATATAKEPAALKPPAEPKAANVAEPRPAPQATGALASRGGTDTTRQGSTKPGTAKAGPAPALATNATAGGTRHEPLPKPPSSHALPPRPQDVSLPGPVSFDRFGSVRVDRRDHSSQRDGREAGGRDVREARDARDPRDARDSRDGRDHRDARDHRSADGSRSDRGRDIAGTGPDRRSADTAPRDHEPRPLDRDRLSRPEPGRGADASRRNDGAPSDRDARQVRDPRPSTPSGRPQDGRLAPPQAPASSDSKSQEPLINPDRARLLGVAERTDMANDSRGPAGRSGRDDTRPSAPSSNASGPPPHQPSHAPDSRRDDRTSRSRPSDHSSRDGPGQTWRERSPERGGGRPFHGPDQPGRLPPPSHQDPNYGRLNPIQSVADLQPSGPGPNTPSGPRGRGGGGRPTGRSGPPTAPAPPPSRQDGRYATPTNGGDAPQRAASPDRHPPTGPSSSRSRRGPAFDGGNAAINASSTAATPAAATPTPAGPGVHPDRLRQMGSGASRPAPSPTSNNVGIHPDRLGHIAPQNSAPGPAASSSRPTRPSSMAQAADKPPLPSGPASAHPPSSHGPGHGNTNNINNAGNNAALDRADGHTTPTGPSTTRERRSAPNKRLLNNIQDIVSRNKDINDSDTNAMEPPGRGSGRSRTPRNSLPDSDAKVVAGSSPATTPASERPDPMRRGGPADRSSSIPEPANRDSHSMGVPNGGSDYPSGRDEHERGGRRDGREVRDRGDRSARHSRRSSRERSPERDRHAKDHREYRDRERDAAGPPPGNALRGAPRDAERDNGPPRRSMREPAAGSGSGARDSRHRGGLDDWNGGSGGPPGAGRGGGGLGGGRGGGSFRESGGAGGTRPGDDRRDLGPGGGHEDRGRKRRSEDGSGHFGGSEREKRQRR